MISYKAGYKYQLVQTYNVNIPIKPQAPVEMKYITLSTDGSMTMIDSYAWDGPSGPTIDTKNFMRGSLVHDALYQLMRLELLPLSYKEQADRLLRQMCREDGMSWIRAWWVYKAVAGFAGGAALPENKKKVLTAP